MYFCKTLAKINRQLVDMNPIITLTTDLGWRDYYVGMVKGGLLSKNADLTIVDISHDVSNYDIVQAAFIVKNVFKSFPKGSIHLINIGNISKIRPYILVIQHEGHYFVGPDNGLFWLLFEQQPEEVYAYSFSLRDTFPIKDIFADVVTHILSGSPLAMLGQPVSSIIQRITIQPIIKPAQIGGAVIHIDNYGNAILNIKRDLFHKVQAERPFSLYFKRYDPIQYLSKHYSDVPIGDTLCLFNSADYLEIAINMGHAGSMLGLDVGDTVQADFE